MPRVLECFECPSAQVPKCSKCLGAWVPKCLSALSAQLLKRLSALSVRAPKCLKSQSARMPSKGLSALQVPECPPSTQVPKCRSVLWALSECIKCLSALWVSLNARPVLGASVERWALDARLWTQDSRHCFWLVQNRIRTQFLILITLYKILWAEISKISWLRLFRRE